MNEKYRMFTKIVRNMKIEKSRVEELNDNEYEALRRIIKYPNCIANDLVEYLNVDKGLVTRILKKLKELDFIITVDGEDKRKKHIFPTPKAIEYKVQIQNNEIRYYQPLFEDISQKEQEYFFNVLKKLYDKSKEMRKKR